MDAGLAIKPVTSVANGHAQPAVALNPSKVTELPGTKIVKPLVKSEATVEERKAAQKSTTHDAIIDPETREVVYRILDSRTRQVIHQVPDQALLRKQAYARAQAAQALADGENPISAAQVASHKVDALT